MKQVMTGPAAPSGSPALPVAFIGTGVMGRSMAMHLLRGGHVLHVFNRTKAKAQDLINEGARWHDSAGSAAAAADVVITMLGFPAEVEECYLGKDGLIERGRPNALLIDMSTGSPALARRIAAAAERHGQAFLDAPVSGGDVGAQEGKLVIMVGGDAAAVSRALPLFRLMGKSTTHFGPAGAGQYCKIANQIAGAIAAVAWAEALAHARSGGLDPQQVLECISGGAAASWSMSHLAPRALQGDFSSGFYVKYLLKDLKIALEAAAELELELPGLTCVHKLYGQVAARGWAGCGTQALYRLYPDSVSTRTPL